MMTEKNNKSKIKGMDLGRILLWSAVAVEAPRWAGAMLAADMNKVDPWLSNILNGGNVLAGLGMGLLNVIAMAYMLDALRHEKPTYTTRSGKTKASFRFWMIVAFVTGLMVLTPFVIAPYMVARMNGLDIATVLGERTWQYAWSVGAVIAPVFVVGGVAFAQNGLVRVAGNSPETEKLTGKEPGKLPESDETPPEVPGDKEPVYRDWREVPESEYVWIANASTNAIVMKYRLPGEDPKRTARNWKKSANDGLKKLSEGGA